MCKSSLFEAISTPGRRQVVPGRDGVLSCLCASGRPPLQKGQDVPSSCRTLLALRRLRLNRHAGIRTGPGSINHTSAPNHTSLSRAECSNRQAESDARTKALEYHDWPIGLKGLCDERCKKLWLRHLRRHQRQLNAVVSGHGKSLGR